MNLYVKPESEDGYIRDACLFRRKINIWDTMAVQVRYHNDVMMNYSLNACMPYEGFSVGFNGTKGRLDAREYHRQPWDVKGLADIRITLNFKKSRVITIGAGGGGRRRNGRLDIRRGRCAPDHGAGRGLHHVQDPGGRHDP